MDVGRERHALSQALLAAAGALVQEQDPDRVLQRACESLVKASSHVRAAWITQASGDGQPVYAAGPGRAALLSARNQEELVHALAQLNSPDHAQLVCFPLEAPGGRGCLAVYADAEDFFEQIGLDSFVLFANVCGGILRQARLRAQLRELAEFDALTGLFTRGAMKPIVEHAHANAKRTGEPYALLLIDVDQFKQINDSYGHTVGDRMLAAIAQRALEAVRDGDWLSRWGGEEFLALLPGAEADEAKAIAERLRQCIGSAPVLAGDVRVPITISAGVACYPLDGLEVDALIEAADVALYEAKRAGRNRVRRANREQHSVHEVVLQIDHALRAGLFVPAYQPIVELSTGQAVGEEALARLVRSRQDVLEAVEFIEIASRRHLVHQIDYQVVRQAVDRCRAQAEAGRHMLHFLNVSADLLRRPDLMQELATLIESRCQSLSNAGASPVVIEVTERDFLDSREARRMLAPFLDLGLRLAVDDFGSGYSSFRYLADLPVNFLKIEGRLVRQARHDAKSRAILRGIQDIACGLNLITLAEGVEDEMTARLLEDINLDWAQGYYFGAPVLAPPDSV